MWQVVTKNGEVISNHRSKCTADKAAYKNRKKGHMLVRKVGTKAQVPQWVLKENERRIRLEILKDMYKKGSLKSVDITRRLT